MMVFDIDVIFSIYRCLKTSMFSFDVPSLAQIAQSAQMSFGEKLIIAEFVRKIEFFDF